MVCQVTMEDFHGNVVLNESSDVFNLQQFCVNAMVKLHDVGNPIFRVLVYCPDGTSADVTRYAVALSKVITYSDLYHHEKV